MTATTHQIHSKQRFDQVVGYTLQGASIQTIQVNIGLKCNLACHHCHVVSSPKRTEQMSRETMQYVLDAASRSQAHTMDITGGAPEMNPNFRWLVDESCKRNMHVIVRTNLTILLVEGYADLPEYFAERGVHLIASLPCYLETNVDKQRGQHVYVESIEAIRRLNALGYGKHESLPLDLVYNPGGPVLPPEQSRLEEAYRRELSTQFGLHFTRLLTITNMPIGRFLHDLQRDGRADEYEYLLRSSFNAATVEPLMCRHQLHVSYDGRLYDCDFNYAIGLGCDPSVSQHIRDFEPATWKRRPIATADHCFGCTAGCGSSCGGALA